MKPKSNATQESSKHNGPIQAGSILHRMLELVAHRVAQRMIKDDLAKDRNEHKADPIAESAQKNCL